MDPETVRFHPEHSLVSEGDDEVVVGISQYAADELGDILFVELPSVGDTIEAGLAMGSVESAKTIADLIAPVSGEVTEVNEAAYDTPEVVGEDPYGEGWLLKVRPMEAGDFDALLDHEDYQASVES